MDLSFPTQMEVAAWGGPWSTVQAKAEVFWGGPSLIFHRKAEASWGGPLSYQGGGREGFERDRQGSSEADLSLQTQRAEAAWGGPW